MAEEVKTRITEPVAVATSVATKTAKKKQRRSVPYGQLHVQASFNNTIVCFTDRSGNLLTQSSAGACGFRGSKKGTAYASQVASEKVAEIAKNQFGAKQVDIFVKGVGLGRDSAIRAMGAFEIQIESIKDVTGVAHGGVRPKKARRV